MDITKLNIVELKALAYDTLATIEQTQNNLKLINQEIQLRLNTPVEKVAEPQVKSTLAENKEIKNKKTK